MSSLFELAVKTNLNDSCGGLLPIFKVIRQGIFPIIWIGIPIVLILMGTIDLGKAVLASDAFFPFNDCVQVAVDAGMTSIIQPGGSVRDQDSIDLCNEHNIPMVFSGFRHFRH